MVFELLGKKHLLMEIPFLRGVSEEEFHGSLLFYRSNGCIPLRMETVKGGLFGKSHEVLHILVPEEAIDKIVERIF